MANLVGFCFVFWVSYFLPILFFFVKFRLSMFSFTCHRKMSGDSVAEPWGLRGANSGSATDFTLCYSAAQSQNGNCSHAKSSLSYLALFGLVY